MSQNLPTPPKNHQPLGLSELRCLRSLQGNSRKKSTIANGKVTVPARTWKIIVVLDKPGLGLKGVNKNTRVIAIDMPNQQGIKNDKWTKYRTSVDRLEQLTGYDFLSLVPENIQSSIESRVDNVPIN